MLFAIENRLAGFLARSDSKESVGHFSLVGRTIAIYAIHF
jgi:hypothetical protein